MYEYNATIRRWVDGDTVDLDIDLGFGIVYANQRVRLFGIDAFESRTRDLQEKQKGMAAKDFVNRMAPVGTQIILRSHKDGKGKFGRILGEIIIDTPKGQQNLNTLLTIEGHAVRYEY
jgi:micrococcal nuclease